MSLGLGNCDAIWTAREAALCNAFGLEEIQSSTLKNRGFNVWILVFLIDTCTARHRLAYQHKSEGSITFYFGLNNTRRIRRVSTKFIFSLFRVFALSCFRD